MNRARWLAAALAGAMLTIPAGAAHASCAEPVPTAQALAEAPDVFVGTVTGLDWQERVATVEVDEVWKGDVGAVAIVNGASPLSVLREAQARGQDVWTSVDRTYAAGGRYLFVPHSRDEAAYLDTQCSATQAYTADLDPLRPADARILGPAGSGRGAAPWLAVVALAAGVLGGGGWLVRRRVRPAAA